MFSKDKSILRWAGYFAAGFFAMILTYPPIAYICAFFAIVLLLLAFFERTYDPFKKKIFPCLRYPYTFDNYSAPEFNQSDIYVDLRPHRNPPYYLKKEFQKGQPVRLVLGVANDNEGVSLKQAKLRVAFDSFVTVKPGLGWGDDGGNKFIFKFGDESINKSSALNASELDITVPYSSTYTVGYSIDGETDRPTRQSGYFIMFLGSQEEYSRQYGQECSVITVPLGINATAATANTAYATFGHPHDPIRRPCQDAKTLLAHDTPYSLTRGAS